MDANDLKHLLTALQAGDLSIEEGLDRLKELPFEDVGIAKIDHHRALRQGVPEVVLGEAKTTKQLEIIVQPELSFCSRNRMKTSAGEKFL
jgi:NCAIR mutase (PurE)-related protein